MERVRGDRTVRSKLSRAKGLEIDRWNSGIWKGGDDIDDERELQEVRPERSRSFVGTFQQSTNGQ